MMFNFLYLPGVIFTTFISSLSFFAISANAQEYQDCFMVTSLGQVVDLNNICINKKAICKGPFDGDGFPISLSTQLEQVKATLSRAEQIDPDNTGDMEEEVQTSVDSFVNQPYFSLRTRELQRKLRLLYEQVGNTTTKEEAVNLKHSINVTVAELKNDLCYVYVLQLLEKEFPQYGLLPVGLE